MRRWSPIIFAALMALFAFERAVNSGALAGAMHHFGGSVTTAPHDAASACLNRDVVLGALQAQGARLTPEPAPFCTNRADVSDWVAAVETAGTRHLAFDAQGCLALWEQAPCE